MATKLKKLEKSAKKLVSSLDSDRRLTIKQSYDITTGLYSRKRGNNPIIAFTNKGDYKISVIKLVLISVGISLALAATLLALKAFLLKLFERRPPKPFFPDNDFPEFDLEDYEDDDSDELAF